MKGRFTTDRRADTSATAVQSSSHHINAAQAANQNRDLIANMAEFWRLI
jgi:hypothetical protein